MKIIGWPTYKPSRTPSLNKKAIMIPKIIHLCWLSGDAYPPMIQTCIDSWKQQLPDYEIRLWDTHRFDINSTLWTRQAFEVKKYAFAADYIRLYALYHEGGIYLDSDVMVYRSFDDLLDLPYFIGEDFIHLFEPAIIGCEPGNPWIGKVLERYHDRPFVKADGSYDLLALPLVFRQQLVPDYSFRRITSKDAFREEAGVMNIFSSEFFNGRDYIGAIRFPNGYCSHCFLGSWLKTESATKGKLRRLLPRALVNLLYRYRYQYSDLHMKQIPYQDPKDLTLRC